MLHFLCWLLITRKYEGDITLDFMLAGHTKLSPDQLFGTLKKQFTETFVLSLPELAQVNQYLCHHIIMKIYVHLTVFTCIIIMSLVMLHLGWHVRLCGSGVALSADAEI